VFDMCLLIEMCLLYCILGREQSNFPLKVSYSYVPTSRL
jgi:hypothetical protein